MKLKFTRLGYMLRKNGLIPRSWFFTNIEILPILLDMIISQLNYGTISGMHWAMNLLATLQKNDSTSILSSKRTTPIETLHSSRFHPSRPSFRIRLPQFRDCDPKLPGPSQSHHLWTINRIDQTSSSSELFANALPH